MTRSRLKNVYLKNQNAINWSNYKYQRSFCTNLLPKTKFDYFRNLNVKELNNNKNSGKKIKSFFSDKGFTSSNIVLKEKGNLITNDKKLTNLFNTYYFINITDILQLKKLPLKFQSLAEVISFYENHGSISKIKEINIIPK